jgi:undecaprenyl-diphosphatase
MTFFAAIAATFLLSGKKRLGLFIFILGLLASWARIFLGVHFPLDIIGSLFVAVGAYVLMTPLWNKWGGAILTFTENIYRKIFSYPIKSKWTKN